MEKEVKEIQNVLIDWDPLGEEKIKIPDLNNYETEAYDISSNLYIYAKNENTAIKIICDTINQAFDLNLSLSDVKDSSSKIWKIYSKYHSKKI